MESIGTALTKEQKEYLQRCIQSLRSKQKSVGVFRQAGMQRTIEGMRKQLRLGLWIHPNA